MLTMRSYFHQLSILSVIIFLCYFFTSCGVVGSINNSLFKGKVTDTKISDRERVIDTSVLVTNDAVASCSQCRQYVGIKCGHEFEQGSIDYCHDVGIELCLERGFCQRSIEAIAGERTLKDVTGNQLRTSVFQQILTESNKH